MFFNDSTDACYVLLHLCIVRPIGHPIDPSTGQGRLIHSLNRIQTKMTSRPTFLYSSGSHLDVSIASYGVTAPKLGEESMSAKWPVIT